MSIGFFSTAENSPVKDQYADPPVELSGSFIDRVIERLNRGYDATQQKFESQSKTESLPGSFAK